MELLCGALSQQKNLVLVPGSPLGRDHQAYRTSTRRRDFLNQDCVFDLGLESIFLRDRLKIVFQQHRSSTTEAVKANASVHFRFTQKATIADKNVIRRAVPSCGHQLDHSMILSAKVKSHRQRNTARTH